MLKKCPFSHHCTIEGRLVLAHTWLTHVMVHNMTGRLSWRWHWFHLCWQDREAAGHITWAGRSKAERSKRGGAIPQPPGQPTSTAPRRPGHPCPKGSVASKRTSSEGPSVCEPFHTLEDWDSISPEGPGNFLSDRDIPANIKIFCS